MQLWLWDESVPVALPCAALLAELPMGGAAASRAAAARAAARLAPHCVQLP